MEQALKDKNLFKIVICDDDTEYIDHLHTAIKTVITRMGCRYEVEDFNDGFALKQYVKKSTVDFLLIDIDMPQISGFETISQIKEDNPDITFIFITAHQEYAYQAFSYYPYQFVIKSDEGRLEEVIESVSEKIMRQRNYSAIVEITSDKRKHLINIEETTYLKANRNYISVFAGAKSIAEFRGSIKDIYSQLSEHYFIFAHRSYIVNCRHIKLFERKKIIMNDGSEIANTRDNKIYGEALKIFGKYKRETK